MNIATLTLLATATLTLAGISDRRTPTWFLAALATADITLTFGALR